MSELKVTENYEIVIIDDPEHSGTDCYGIQNNEYGVIEYYDNLYPRAVGAMESMQKAYDDMNDPQMELATVSAMQTQEPTH